MVVCVEARKRYSYKLLKKAGTIIISQIKRTTNMSVSTYGSATILEGG